MEGGMDTIIDTPDGIRVFHLLQLKYAMKLEMKGLRHSQGSVYAHVKRLYGLKGNRQKVYDKFCEMHNLEK